jgi:hypothetical protein
MTCKSSFPGTFSFERRRRFYRRTAEGQRVLAQQEETWAAFVDAARRITGGEHA